VISSCFCIFLIGVDGKTLFFTYTFAFLWNNPQNLYSELQHWGILHGIKLCGLQHTNYVPDLRIKLVHSIDSPNIGTGFGPMACVAFGLKLRA
jgi:hypothetical protein